MVDQTECRYDVFISYDHADRTWVHGELLPWLKEAGLKVCIDECDFEVGTPSLVNMERAVDNSRHTLLVLTPAWIEGEWTEFESLLAGTGDPAGRRRRLIPLMLEPCKLPPRIAMLTCADLTQPSERGVRMARLIKSLKPLTTPEPPDLTRRDDRDETKLKSKRLSDKALRTLRDPVWQGIGVLVAIIVAFLTIPPLQHLFWKAAPVPTSSPTFTPLPASTWTPIPVVVTTVAPTPTATVRTPTLTYTPSPTSAPTLPLPTPTGVPLSNALVTYGTLTYGPNKQTVANGTKLNTDSLIYCSITNVSGRRLLVEARGLRVDPLQNFINGELVGRPESMTGAFYLEIDETVQIKVLLTDIRCSPCTIFPSALLPKKQDAVPGDPKDWLWVPGPSYRVIIQ